MGGMGGLSRGELALWMEAHRREGYRAGFAGEAPAPLDEAAAGRCMAQAEQAMGRAFPPGVEGCCRRLLAAAAQCYRRGYESGARAAEPRAKVRGD